MLVYRQNKLCRSNGYQKKSLVKIGPVNSDEMSKVDISNISNSVHI